MKTLCLECGMGAAGDMLMAALLELIPDKQAFIDKMNTMNLPGVHVEAVLPYTAGALLSQVREFGHVESVDYEADGVHLSADVDSRLAAAVFEAESSADAGDSQAETGTGDGEEAELPSNDGDADGS